jgi:hypothetical protein
VITAAANAGTRRDMVHNIQSHAIHKYLKDTFQDVEPEVLKDWARQDFLKNQRSYRVDPLPFIAINTILTCAFGIILLAHIIFGR